MSIEKINQAKAEIARHTFSVIKFIKTTNFLLHLPNLFDIIKFNNKQF